MGSGKVSHTERKASSGIVEARSAHRESLMRLKVGDLVEYLNHLGDVHPVTGKALWKPGWCRGVDADGMMNIDPVELIKRDFEIVRIVHNRNR